MSSAVIVEEIEIDAPVAVVWRTITEPASICRWFSDIADIEASVGAVGSLTFRAGSHDPLVVAVTVVDVLAPWRFSYRWVHPVGQAATEANSTLVTFTLLDLGADRTRLRVVESGIETMDLSDADRRRFVEDHRHGWQVQTARLRDLLATGAPPR